MILHFTYPFGNADEPVFFVGEAVERALYDRTLSVVADAPPGTLPAPRWTVDDRDAVVKQEATFVPAGCDATGWSRVVNVLASDNWEDGHHSRLVPFLESVHRAREALPTYSLDRFAHGYSVDESLLRVLGLRAERPVLTFRELRRICCAYEAGRRK